MTNMGFKRTWNSSCPQVWDSWEKNGTKWVIQDLAPEDDEKAIEILREHLVRDETLCVLSELYQDPKSLQAITDFWQECLKQRMTLACYTEVEGKKTLVALNVCVVDTVDNRIPDIETIGEGWINVFNALEYIEKKCDSFEYFGYNTLLHALGLSVRREYRGEKIGSRLLSAREPLSLAHGIKATSTVFTGPASQKSAERSGFKSICEVSLKELSENGMNYPPDEVRMIKLMGKSYINMGFKRTWDTSCPRVWDSWQKDGTKWVIQDLAPEDDETAIEILREHLVRDEALCVLSKVYEDPKSLQAITDFWQECLKQRMTLACYTEVEGKKTLVALNVCVVDTIDNRIPDMEIIGEGWINVFNALVYIEKKCDSFEYFGYDTLLHALGLSVRREYRGKKIGSRLLSAREPLSLAHGIKATSTVFTGPASQKSAERSGFKSICEVSLKELSENGMNYPPDENRTIKLMGKSYV